MRISDRCITATGYSPWGSHDDVSRTFKTRSSQERERGIHHDLLSVKRYENVPAVLQNVSTSIVHRHRHFRENSPRRSHERRESECSIYFTILRQRREGRIDGGSRFRSASPRRFMGPRYCPITRERGFTTTRKKRERERASDEFAGRYVKNEDGGHAGKWGGIRMSESTRLTFLTVQ